MTEGVGPSALRMSIWMVEPSERESLMEVSGRFYEIHSLLIVGSLFHYRESVYDSPEPLEAAWARTMYDARGVANSFRVTRVSYNSPWWVDLLQFAHDHPHYIAASGAAIGAKRLWKEALGLREAYFESGAKVAKSKQSIADSERKIAESRLDEAKARAELDLVSIALENALKERETLIREEERTLTHDLGFPLPSDAQQAVSEAAVALLAIEDIHVEGEAESA